MSYHYACHLTRTPITFTKYKIHLGLILLRNEVGIILLTHQCTALSGHVGELHLPVPSTPPSLEHRNKRVDLLPQPNRGIVTRVEASVSSCLVPGLLSPCVVLEVLLTPPVVP